jgi:hypothetical protein
MKMIHSVWRTAVGAVLLAVSTTGASPQPRPAAAQDAMSADRSVAVSSNVPIVNSAGMVSRGGVLRLLPACRCCQAEPQPGRDPDSITGGPIPPIDGPIVRVAYLIPSNRLPQEHGVETLQNAVRWWHVWFHRQMSHYGFGAKSFRYETEPDGLTPLIHVVDVPATDAEMRTDPWGAVINAASNGGVPVWATGQVWLLVPEMHVQHPDGSIEGGVALGASFGSGLDPGVAVLGSNGLAMMRPAFLTNDQSYHGHIVPEIGPYPLVQDVSFAWFEGSSFSSVSSSYLGAGAHELTHGFGIGHDLRNDQNFHGNMMGNGLRGFRGAAYPASYLADSMRLSYGHALALNTSRYFLADPQPVENVKPSVTVHTGGGVVPVDGHVEIAFSASDASGLAAALLRMQGNTIAEIHLSGTSVTETFRTSYYAAGSANQYEILVYDVHGNRRDVNTTVVPATGHNAAPRAEFKIVPPIALPGQSVLLDASLSNDPDHPASQLVVEWDLTGDGNYDTDPTTTKTLSISKDEPGVYLIRVRVTDPLGAQTESSRIALHIRKPGDINGDGVVDGTDLLHLLSVWGACPEMPATCPGDLSPSELGDGLIDGTDLLFLLANWG